MIVGWVIKVGLWKCYVCKLKYVFDEGLVVGDFSRLFICSNCLREKIDQGSFPVESVPFWKRWFK